MDDFQRRAVRAVGKPLFRVGIAGGFGLDQAGFRRAFERGVQYAFWGPHHRSMTPALRDALKNDRQAIAVATGPVVAVTAGSVRRAAERALRALGTDYLDVFHLFWLGKTSSYTPSTVDALVRLRDEGKVKAIAVSIHDRQRAARLAVDSPLDLLMLRYNAAHPGAEVDIFPHLAARKPSVVAYTATCWRRLLEAPAGWDGQVPNAGHCYRFCLSNPHVDLVLMGVANTGQLDANLAAVAEGPLSEQEMTWMRAFGQQVRSRRGRMSSALGLQ